MTMITEKIGSGEVDGNKDIRFNDTDEVIISVDERQLVLESVEPIIVEEKSPKKKKGWFNGKKKG
jgi:hypothetical protein